MNHIIVEDKLRDTNPVPVVIAFTPNYFIPASTCLYSIFASLDIEEQIHVICLLSEELPDRLKQKIQLIGGERAQYSFINLQGRLQNIYILMQNIRKQLLIVCYCRTCSRNMIK